jgi:aspartate/methionine/tyrosine aminotransferase
VDLAHGFLPGEMPALARGVALEAWRGSGHGFAAGPGLQLLREAVVEWLDLRGLRTADDVLVAPGSRAATSVVLAAVSSPGDIVLVDAGAWNLFQHTVSVGGATAVPVVGTGQHLKLTARDLRAQLDNLPGVRAVLVANPVNPTAQVYDERELTALVDACAAARVFCVVDRLYGKLVYDGRRFPWLPASPGARDWLILVDGVARAFRGMRGLRVGWACGPRDVIDAAAVVQQHVMGPADGVAQRVALAALNAPWDLGILEELTASRDALLDVLAAIPGLSAWPVAGTMFCLVDASRQLGLSTRAGWVIESGVDLADFALAEAGVLVSPGDMAGRTGLLRLAFSQPPEVVAEGAERLGDALGTLR